MENDIVLQIYSRPETVFSIDEISQIVPTIPYKSLRDRLYYSAKSKKILHPRLGIYTKKQYNPLELASKIYIPSYISLETVLSQAGVVFQYYERIFVVSYVTRTISTDHIEIQYRQIKKEILTNMLGIEQKVGYFIASLERAFLDTLYIYKNYHFDNLGVINWEKVHYLKQLYKSKVLAKRVDDYYKQYKKDYGQH